jgi:(1->4)-alpha-D-glucan 1-alpha-D-glucosylmutase
MLSTSTHDTKRSEDVRARINVLSELPDEWAEHLKSWAKMNAGAKIDVKGHRTPLPNDEYLLYQTMLGAYPEKGEEAEAFILRMARYMEKATNEAKLVSNWLNPHEAYADAVEQFIKTIWDNKAFRESFLTFQRRLAWFGRFNSLAQVVLKLTSPGVPDIYQGMELWETSLVDPDNRRPVDYKRRSEMLADLQARADKDPAALAAELLAEPENSALKLYVTERALRWRRDHEDLACDGVYVPLEVTGKQAEHVCAFLRQNDVGVVLVVVPRLLVGLLDGREDVPVGAVWGDTAVALPDKLPAKSLRNVFTGVEVEVKGKSVLVRDLLAEFPVGLWVG